MIYFCFQFWFVYQVFLNFGYKEIYAYLLLKTVLSLLLLVREGLKLGSKTLLVAFEDSLSLSITNLRMFLSVGKTKLGSFSPYEDNKPFQVSGLFLLNFSAALSTALCFLIRFKTFSPGTGGCSKRFFSFLEKPALSITLFLKLIASCKAASLSKFTTLPPSFLFFSWHAYSKFIIVWSNLYIITKFCG